MISCSPSQCSFLSWHTDWFLVVLEVRHHRWLLSARVMWGVVMSNTFILAHRLVSVGLCTLYFFLCQPAKGGGASGGKSQTTVLFYLLLDHFNPYVHTPTYSKFSFIPTTPSVVTFPLLLNLSCLQNLTEWSPWYTGSTE